MGTQAAAREFRVKVRLDSPAPSLRPGLTCDTEILVAERKNALTVPLQAVVEKDGKTGVFVVRDGGARFTPVTTGIIGGLSIEDVVSGKTAPAAAASAAAAVAPNAAALATAAVAAAAKSPELN